MIDAAFAIRMQRAKDESEVWFRGFYEKIPKWWDENNRLPPHRLALEKTHIPAHGSVEWVVGEGEPRRNDITAARDVWLDRTTGEVACDLSIPDPRHQLRTYYEQKAAEGRALALRNVMHVAFRRTKGLKRNTENGETWQDVVRAELPYHPELADLGWELLRSSAWEMYDMIMALLPTDRRQFFAVRGHIPEPVSLRDLHEARKRSKF